MATNLGMDGCQKVTIDENIQFFVHAKSFNISHNKGSALGLLKVVGEEVV